MVSILIYHLHHGIYWLLLLFRDLADHVCSTYSSVIAGCILKRLFQNPYVLNNRDGKIWIKDNMDIGVLYIWTCNIDFFNMVCYKEQKGWY